jgi:hypothetical protein
MAHPAVRRLLAAVAILISTVLARAATITVNDTGDTIAVDGKITLREAMTSIMSGSNVNADVSAAGTYGVADEIDFSIGSGSQVIIPASALPTITKPVKIDGTTQPGFAGSPLIQLQGNLAGASTDGLTLSAHSGSVIRGLIIVLFGGDGIVVTGTGGSHIIAGNWIGLTTIGGAGNGGNGLTIDGVPNNQIGGTVSADRNVVSDNGASGIEIQGAGATGNVIEGNFIGMDQTGTVALGNSSSFHGVAIDDGAGHNTVGGTAAGSGNLISANGTGVLVQAASNNTIQGNFIGTDVTGKVAKGNVGDGVDITGTAAHNLVGGTTSAARNVISGNGAHGVLLGGCAGSSGGSNVVSGNFIGVAADNSALGNGGDGVRVTVDQHDSTIGGTQAGAGNTIALNSGNGVGIQIDSFCGALASGISILGNAIHHNNLLGIDLGLDGVTANDALDADPGVNGLQNYPVVTAAASNGVTVTVTGTFHSKPGSAYRLEFFANPSCSPSAAEGQAFMGFANVTTNASGDASFTAHFAAPSSVNFVTATATDSLGSTSEFSVCQAVAVVPNNPPVATADAYSTPFETALNVAAPGVLGNDSDPDGDPITAVKDTDPAHGSVSLSADGSFLYTPNPGFAGVDTFTYHANDGSADSNVATVTITVFPARATGIPIMDFRGMMVLAGLLALAALKVLRRD